MKKKTIRIREHGETPIEIQRIRVETGGRTIQEDPEEDRPWQPYVASKPPK